MRTQALELSHTQPAVPLQGVEVEASLRNLLVEVTLTQTYRNVEDESIEAVFTFPVPRDALLLNVELELGERRLRGQVVARATARESYEEAVTDGDTAVLLEELEPGLYHLSLGNLQPGETAVLRYRYVQLLYWQQGLRFALPTALAPRYGDPAASGLDPVQAPEVDLLTSYPFTFRMRVEGRLAGAKVGSPTHEIALQPGEDALEISFSHGEDTLDRDLVLVFSLEEPLPPAALLAPDGEQWVALATLPLPEGSDLEDQAPRCIPILVDCSGSMQGDSIAQARKALGRILDALRPQDHFNIIRFGSHIEPLFPAPRAASKETLNAAKALLDRLKADLGGTEIGRALAAAFKARPDDFATQDILLITDGEVWNGPEFVKRAQSSGDRVFTVGVGHAVSEAFLRELADKTGGACELVTPREDIGARIERHFQRIYQPRLKAPRIAWPTAPERQTPAKLEGIYLGDTLHLFAWFNERPEGLVCFTATEDESATLRLEAKLHLADSLAADTLPRLAAQAGLVELPESDRIQVAERYQLLMDQTAWLILAQRADEERSDGLPALRKVPHMLAAGWGGTGSHVFHCNRTGAVSIAENISIACMLRREDEDSYSAFWQDQTDDTNQTDSIDLDTVAACFVQHFNPTWLHRSPKPTIADLEVLGIPDDCVAELEALLDEDTEVDEATVVACFLAILLQAHRDSMPRLGAQRVLRVYEKWGRRLSESIRGSIRQVAERCFPSAG